MPKRGRRRIAPAPVGRRRLVGLLVLSCLGAPTPWSALTAPALAGTAHAQGSAAPVRLGVVAERSTARYRVREQLAGLSFPNDAVGATSAVEGGIALDAQGRVVAGGSRLAVDLRTLKSDEPRRDNYVRRNTLETDRYPTAVLVPIEMRGLPAPLPQAGTASLELVADLTIRDVTRRLTWEATATFAGPEVRVLAKTTFRFEEFGLRVPRVSVVLGVEDQIHLEADLVFRRVA